MAAAPFLGVVKARYQDGFTDQWNVTISDVNAAYWIFPDLNNNVILSTQHGYCDIYDIILSAAGTDTRTANIFVNGKPSSMAVQNGANLASNQARQFTPGAPLRLAAGANLRFTQVT